MHNTSDGDRHRRFDQLVGIFHRDMYGYAIWLCRDARLVVDQQEEPVVKTARAEVVDLAVDDRGQTDPGVADASEGNHVRLTGQLALREVMIRELVDQERPRLAAPLDEHDVRIDRETGLAERLAAVGDAVAFEHVGLFESRASGIE